MEHTEIELKSLDKGVPGPDNNNLESEEGSEVNQGNGNHLVQDPQEQRPLLPSQSAESNGVTVNIEPATNPTSAQEQKPKLLKRLKKELNEPVFNSCGKIKLWMAILIILFLIISVIVLILFLCSGHKSDADEKYDRSSFVTPLNFTGSFRLSNSSLVLDLLSNKKNELLTNLNEKLSDIYTSSPALERYFFLANTAMSPKNDTVDYDLVFKMPKEHNEIKRYTLSREVVYHVLLQNLFDQDTEDQLYIEPSSLSMERVDN